MPKIEKIDAFSMVIKALEDGDEQTANRLMKIIGETIQEDSRRLRFSNQFEIKKTKDARYFKDMLVESFVDDQDVEERSSAKTMCLY